MTKINLDDMKEGKKEVVRLLPPDKVIANWEDNGRAFPYTREECQDLIDDYRSGVGQIQDVLVRPAQDNRVRLVLGFRRRTAMLFANEDLAAEGQPLLLLRCRIVDDINDEQAQELNERENLGRIALGPVSKAILIKRMKKRGLTIVQIAQKFIDPRTRKPVSTAHITQYQKFNRVPEDIQRLLEAELLPLDEMFKLVDLPEDELRARLLRAQELDPDNPVITVTPEGTLVAIPQEVEFTANPEEDVLEEAQEDEAATDPEGLTEGLADQPETPAPRKRVKKTPTKKAAAKKAVKKKKLSPAALQAANAEKDPGSVKRTIRDLKRLAQEEYGRDIPAATDAERALFEALVKWFDSKAFTDRKLHNVLKEVLKAKL